MPDEPAAAPRQALKYTGDPAKGEILGGIPAQDLTAEQVAIWLTQEQYDEALASQWYSVPTKTEAKAIAAAAQPPSAVAPKESE